MQAMDAPSIMLFQDRKLGEKAALIDGHGEPMMGIWQIIETNHRFNILLWNEEDKARRIDVSAEHIAASKRLIDQYNQSRNDAIEGMDEAILLELDCSTRLPDARLNSETAGSMIDRLSILGLKIYHMGAQTRRSDAGLDHVKKCAAKKDLLVEQRQDLGHCFDALLEGARAGHAYFKVYRQFKMYNDPTLNPYLYSTHPMRGEGAGA